MQVTRDPYPHLVLENAVSEELCRELIREFPPLDVFTKGKPIGDNVKIYYPAVRVLEDPRVSPTWKQFLRDHLTPEWYREIVRVFRPYLLEEYPNLEKDFGKLESLRAGMMGRESFDRCDILLDALLGIHTPVANTPRLERLPHVKGRDKPLEGFLYLRQDDDTAEGAAYEFFSAPAGSRPRFGRWRQTPREGLRLDRTVPYGRNTLVIVMNSRRSIQALSPRGPGSRPLMYFNLTVRVPRKLFDLDYTMAGRAHEYIHDWMDRLAPG